MSLRESAPRSLELTLEQSRRTLSAAYTFAPDITSPRRAPRSRTPNPESRSRVPNPSYPCSRMIFIRCPLSEPSMPIAAFSSASGMTLLTSGVQPDGPALDQRERAG